MRLYGSDKPDLRFGMKFVELMDVMKLGKFAVFDDAVSSQTQQRQSFIDGGVGKSG